MFEISYRISSAYASAEKKLVSRWNVLASGGRALGKATPCARNRSTTSETESTKEEQQFTMFTLDGLLFLII